MQITEAARLAGASPKALRYYERLGLLTPERRDNGYRTYSSSDVRVVREIRALAAAGIAPGQSRPFVDCLRDGHEHSDECPASLAAYREEISALDELIASLGDRRTALADRLEQAASRTFPKETMTMSDYTVLPSGLPIPVDDGAADHLPGLPLPDLTLRSSDGADVRLQSLPAQRTIIYLYPMTGQPGVDLPDGWDAIPGARGCSTEACDFRDHFADLRAAGVTQVWGLSSQEIDYQDEVVRRLQLPFAMLSDPCFAFADALRLPTFAASGHPRLYTRLTLVIRDGAIEHAFYPIFPPNTHAQQVLTWLAEHPAR